MEWFITQTLHFRYCLELSNINTSSTISNNCYSFTLRILEMIKAWQNSLLIYKRPKIPFKLKFYRILIESFPLIPQVPHENSSQPRRQANTIIVKGPNVVH